MSSKTGTRVLFESGFGRVPFDDVYQPDLGPSSLFTAARAVGLPPEINRRNSESIADTGAAVRLPPAVDRPLLARVIFVTRLTRTCFIFNSDIQALFLAPCERLNQVQFVQDTVSSYRMTFAWKSA